MSKIYLQELITPVPNKYIIVGNDGNLTAGDLPTNTFPTITINAPAAVNQLVITTTNPGQSTATATKTTTTKWVCNPPQFGIWTITGTSSSPAATYIESIEVTEITEYVVTLS